MPARESHTPHEKPVLLIAGPTASGKSACALRLAEEKGGVIINADSMQVYRELRVLTARPNPAEEAAAPHRLYGHVGADEAYSVARWQAEALAEINAAHQAGLVPILVGGTGLYFMSLLKGLAEVPEIDPEIRQKWRNFEGPLHAELAARDPASAARLHPSDRQRLVRALEVKESTGHSLLDWQAQAAAAAPLNHFNVTKRFMDLPRELLYARAEARFDEMLNQGALEELRTLPPLDPDVPLMKAIGVPELLAHLRGETSLAAASAAAKTATRNYIKRQLTWWRGQMADWQSVATAG